MKKILFVCIVLLVSVPVFSMSFDDSNPVSQGRFAVTLPIVETSRLIPLGEWEGYYTFVDDGFLYFNSMEGSLGYFVSDGLEIGPYFYLKSWSDWTALDASIGLFATYYFHAGNLLPYVGLMGLLLSMSDGAAIDTKILEASAGISFPLAKNRIAPYAALVFDFYSFESGSDDTYIMGDMEIGLKAFF